MIPNRVTFGLDVSSSDKETKKFLEEATNKDRPIIHDECIKRYMNSQSAPDLNWANGTPNVCCFCGKS